MLHITVIVSGKSIKIQKYICTHTHTHRVGVKKGREKGSFGEEKSRKGNEGGVERWMWEDESGTDQKGERMRRRPLTHPRGKLSHSLFSSLLLFLGHFLSASIREEKSEHGPKPRTKRKSNKTWGCIYHLSTLHRLSSSDPSLQRRSRNRGLACGDTNASLRRH